MPHPKHFTEEQKRKRNTAVYQKDPYNGWSEERKAQSRANAQRWAVKNPEKAKEIERKWRERNPHKRPWAMLKSRAKRHGLAVDITYDFFCGLRDANRCHYCDGSLPLQGSGIDRKNPTLGYVAGNCIPCCGLHNRMKWIMGYDTFIEECRMIAERFRS
jgi:hypothetical protein